MVGRMHSVSQKPDRGENRMTEEERIREVERISRRTKESVKIPPDQQRIIRIVRFKSGKLATCIGTLEDAIRYQTYKKYNIQVAKSQDLSRRKPAIFLTFFRGQGSPFRA